jgi:calcineurin-like phosphoesterase family protein
MFFSSDHHFFHKNIKKFQPFSRKGDTIDEMNELIISAHNDRVSKNDVVFFLGDFSFGDSKQTYDILSRMNGKKNLVYGNHDKIIRSNFHIQKLFESVQDYLRISVGKKSVVLFHFPIAEFDSMHYGSYHLHGHTHGNFSHSGRAMDVGIDTRPSGDMAPWTFEEIDEILKHQPIISHHG